MVQCAWIALNGKVYETIKKILITEIGRVGFVHTGAPKSAIDSSIALWAPFQENLLIALLV